MKEIVIEAIRKLMVQCAQCLQDGNETDGYEGRCSYYSEGDRCIVGWMLTEESAKKLTYAELPIPALGKQHFIAAFGRVLTEEEMNWLQELQSHHDCSQRPEFFCESFKRFTQNSVNAHRLPEWVMEGFVQPV
jgi:hypothetical protein